MTLPIDASFGHRFFLKGNNNYFIDPVWTYSTAYFVKAPRYSEWTAPFKEGKIPAVEVRFGSVMNNNSSIYILLPKVGLGYYVSNGYFAPTIGTGLGAEWKILPVVSLTARAEVTALAPNGKMGISSSVKVGVEFHGKNYYSA